MVDMPLQRATSAVRNIFHPTDLSPESEVAFVHALKIAIVTHSALRIMHVQSESSEREWSDFPRVRATLARWGTPTDKSAGDDSFGNLHVNKILAHRHDPASSILHELKGNPADLIVLATHQHDALDRLMGKAVAEPVALQSGVRTLFIPAGIKGFVDLENGEVRLGRILIPVDETPSPQPAIDAAVALTSAIGQEQAAFTLLYIGQETNRPSVNTVSRSGWTWTSTIRPGDVIEQVLQAESECNPDLIVMASAGRQDFLDLLRGSTTERVIRGARCPVFVIPTGSESAAEHHD